LKAANWLSAIVFKTKELNSNRLAKAHYAHLRSMGLLSQLACSICKVVCSTYKAIKSHKRWDLAIFTRPVMPIVWNRDFRITRKGVTLWGELLSIHDPRPLPTGNWKDSKLKRIDGQWYLFLAHEIDIPAPKTTGSLVGVDMGIKRMLVATNSANSKTFFYHGGELNHRRCCIRRVRASVQSVGTRGSRRLLRRMGHHEAAVTGHLLHVASKALVRYSAQVGARRIVMENLENIRDSSLEKGKDFRSKIHRWPYADMRFKVDYKARAEGMETEVVSPRNTSRGCNACGHVSASNRHGLTFHCVKCGHHEDADRHASKNIRGRSVAIEHNSAATGSYKAPQSYGTVDLDVVSCLHSDPILV
jgi:IS605 OrfB family transposase